MQLTVKTLKGEKFVINAELSNTIADVKTIIEAEKSELPAASMKLIHSGKVLKDTDTIESCNIKPNAFLVVMIAKAKKAAAAPAPAPAPADPPVAPVATPSQAPPTAAAPAPSSQEETSTTTASTSTPAPTSDSDEFPAEVISNLTGMGFPEAEVRACLRASQGNPDVAVEFLMNGIPPAVQAVQQSATSSTPATGSAPSVTSGRTEPLQALRDHPQINQLRVLVQSNPQTLQAVLTQIGQQDPELLREINSNQAAFLQIMNEPVEENNAPATPAPSSTSTTTPPPAPGPTTGGAGSGAGGGFGLGMLEGMSNPAQMAEMLQSMNPTELQGMATMMGLTPEQLTATAQMISQMPPEQFQEYMNMAMQGGGMAGLMGGMGGGAEGGAGSGGPQVLRLSEEEMAAVDRLADMGFDRAEAAQAYLACDKNEALAANLLMDGGFGFDETDMGGGANGGGGGGGNDDDDMYD